MDFLLWLLVFGGSLWISVYCFLEEKFVMGVVFGAIAVLMMVGLLTGVEASRDEFTKKCQEKGGEALKSGENRICFAPGVTIKVD